MAALLEYLVIVLVSAILDNRVKAVPSVDENRVLLTYNNFHDTCRDITDTTQDVSKAAADEACEEAFFALDRLRLNGCFGWRLPKCRLVDDDQYNHYQCTCLTSHCDELSIRSHKVTPFRDCVPASWTEKLATGVSPAPFARFQQSRSQYDNALEEARWRRTYSSYGRFDGASSSYGVYTSGGAGTSNGGYNLGEADGYNLLYTSGDDGNISEMYVLGPYESPTGAYLSNAPGTLSGVTAAPDVAGSEKQDKPHSCDKCEAKFSSTPELFVHKRIHHFVANFHCYLCNKTYTYKKGYIGHLREKHPEVAAAEGVSRRKPMDPAEGGKDPLICPFCLRKYTTKNGLTDHLKSHTTDDTTCHMCTKTFSTIAIFRAHMQYIHPTVPIPKPAHVSRGPTLRGLGSGDYECAECGKRYVNRRGLWDHEQSHKSLITYCLFCDRTYSSKNSYQKHMSMTHPDWAALEQEVEAAKREQDWPEKCPQCDKRFRNSDGLREHMYYHEGKTRCDMCGLVFPRRNTLYAHKKKEHPNSTQKKKDQPSTSRKRKEHPSTSRKRKDHPK